METGNGTQEHEAGVSQEPADKTVYWDNSLFISHVPLDLKREVLITLFATQPGFVRLQLSEPIRAQHGTRYAWIEFESASHCRETQEKLQNQPVTDTFRLHIRPKSKPRRGPRVIASVSLDPTRIEHDLQLAVDLTKQLNTEKGLDADWLLTQLPSQGAPLRQLNILLQFLRDVHFYRFYLSREHF
eukprot:GABV01001314.1.p2 GENE.GABV01001314.1~~GABV01001314.1.p2  ORF type:complete len:186 (+),score=66.61 GABV01001314.1:139-696(+)